MSPFFGRTRATPRLSVVVPVYNVEPYVAECLDSLLAQEFQDFEVIAVDDGSTDGSAAVVERYLRGNPKISLVHTGNHGLGAARNHGVRLARGELLAFVDSDDTLPPYAYALMVSTLDESGSELVVGSVQQQIDGKLVEPAFLRRAHRQRLLGVTLEEHPEAMRNVFAWGKVFRRSLWERAGLGFPEGVRYEDQGTIIEAYLRAEAFDVVVRPVYRWRIRSDGSSITQRRHEIADLRDRLATKQMATEIVRRLGSPRLVDYWARNGLPGDLPVYFREIPGCDDAYWRLLHTGVRDLFEGLPPIQQSRLWVPQRVVGWLVTQGRRAEAETLLAWLADNPGPLPLRVEGDHVVAELPLAPDSDLGVPPDLCWLHDDELEFDARLQSVAWAGSTLEVSGLGLIRGAPTEGVTTVISARLESADAVLPMHVAQRFAPEATMWVNRGSQRYDSSGFTARVSIDDMVSASAGAARDWRVIVEVEVAQIRRHGPLRTQEPGVTLPEPLVTGAMVSFRPPAGLVLHVPAEPDAAAARTGFGGV